MTKVLYVVAVVWVALFVWQTIAHAAPAWDANTSQIHDRSLGGVTG